MKTRVPGRAILAVWLAAGTVTLAAPAAANERHFTYAYESAVLPRGARELEFWSTYRTARHDFYSRLDQRAEFEVGLSDHLMTALYLNWQDIATADPTTGKVGSEFSWQGISSEWKYKLSDPVADRLGSALYGEAQFSTRGMELEAKLILDKRAAKNLVAYNLVVEGEWARTSGGLEREEVALEHDLGWTHFFRPSLAAGLELRNLTVFTPEHSPRHSALFLGPVVSYGGDHWWAALTAQAQLPALKRSVEDPGERLVLDDLERLNVRLLFSYEW